jgi:hypothetical protein
MKNSVVSWKSVAVTFVLALAFYLLAWSWMTRWQTGRGPWQVAFATNDLGVPRIVVQQPALGISNVVVTFPGEMLFDTNATGIVHFARPQQKTPFGRVVFDDLMRQPGTLTLDLFGHEVELIPARLTVNRQPLLWTNNAVLELSPTNKLPADAPRPKKSGYR